MDWSVWSAAERQTSIHACIHNGTCLNIYMHACLCCIDVYALQVVYTESEMRLVFNRYFGDCFFSVDNVCNMFEFATVCWVCVSACCFSLVDVRQTFGLLLVDGLCGCT